MPTPLEYPSPNFLCLFKIMFHLVRSQFITPECSRQTHAISPVSIPLCRIDRPGPKSLLSLALEPKHHAASMKVFDRVFSPAAMLKLQPTVEIALTKRVARWYECAASGEVIAGIRGGAGVQNVAHVSTGKGVIVAENQAI